MIANSSGVIAHFGYWPLFCDAKVESFSFSLPGTLKLSVRYIDADQNKKATIDLLFSGITNMELNELRTENVVDEIIIREGVEIEVSIEAAYGLCGSFSCTKGVVAHVTYA